MANKIPFKWGNANFAWNTNPFGAQQNKNPFTWDDCALVDEILEVIQAGGPYQEVFKDKEKKKRFIKLICQVEGVEYKETKKIKDVNIRIQDVELVINEVLGVNLEVKI